MHIDDSSAMQILEEIKALMDSRMTDKMSMSDDMGNVASEIPNAKGIEMQKIKLLGGNKDENPLDSMSHADEPGDETQDDEKKEEDLMRKIRKELM